MARRSVTSDAVVLGAATGLFGISFGVLAIASELSVAKACAMSLLVFTGASQFAAVGVLASGGSPASALASALFLAARNGAYGLALSPVLKGGRVRRLVAAQLVIDESTALATAQHDRASAERGFWSAVAVFVCWNAGTLLGALGGQAIGDPGRLGLDAAFPAGFVALIAPHLASRQGRTAALIGASTALVLVPLSPPGIPVLAAAAAAGLALLVPTTLAPR